MENKESIYSVFQKNHLRLTKTRKALVSAFLETNTPLSVPDILDEFHQLRITMNKTTVYRELLRMQSIGIVGSVQLSDRKQYFELASRRHHHHLVCIGCETVEDIDVDEEELHREEHKASRERHFTILRHSLEFFGLCRRCQS